MRDSLLFILKSFTMNSIKNLHRLKRLHQLIRSECTGTPYELFKLADQQGMQAFVYRSSSFDVDCIPCLVQLNYMDLGHYVVVYGHTANKIQIMDPSVGRMYWVSETKFQRLWSGFFLVL